MVTSPHRARAAVNTRELQPLQVCQHILDTKERLHSSLLYPDPAALPSPDAADVPELLCSPGSCCRTGLCSQARSESAPGAGLLPRNRSVCHRVCYFSLNSFSGNSIKQVTGPYLTDFKKLLLKVCSNMMLCQE